MVKQTKCVASQIVSFGTFRNSTQFSDFKNVCYNDLIVGTARSPGHRVLSPRGVVTLSRCLYTCTACSEIGGGENTFSFPCVLAVFGARLFRDFRDGFSEARLEREDKTSITHLGRKKLGQSISRVNWQTRDVGWPILLAWSVYFFSPIPGRKYHIRVFEPGAKVALSARVW